VQALDKSEQLTNATNVEQHIEQSLAGPRFRAALIGSFAILALALAAVGVYGVTAYSISQCTHEFGIRMALGAQPTDILRSQLSGSLVIIAIGVCLGCASAVAAGRAIQSLLFEVQLTDPVSMFWGSALIFSSCMLSTYLAARRTRSIDPQALMRHE
jgi:putative ABC transport system permease protein